ncbi:MAG: hypothetical protein OXU29_06945, partial [Gammaproteobacteria bacterium]|nr:hypothetical protein [Gammaproteobacteria bacterium]
MSPDVFTASAADVSLVNNIITFAAGEDSKQFSVTIVGDDLSEDDESFAIGLGFSGAIVGVTPILVTITDDDAVRTLTVTGPATVAEGAAA